jgi:hypothetical protein
MKEDKNKQHQDNEEQKTRNDKEKEGNKFLDANKENDPHADRSAKTSRKGAGQQQNSSGSPINS